MSHITTTLFTKITHRGLPRVPPHSDIPSLRGLWRTFQTPQPESNPVTCPQSAFPASCSPGLPSVPWALASPHWPWRLSPDRRGPAFAGLCTEDPPLSVQGRWQLQVPSPLGVHVPSDSSGVTLVTITSYSASRVTGHAHTHAHTCAHTHTEPLPFQAVMVTAR